MIFPVPFCIVMVKEKEIMINDVKQYMEKYHMILPGETVVAGVSGGADSVCLLLLLQEYRKEVPFSLAVVHVNHRIRANAAEDALFVQKLCDDFAIPCYLFEEDIEDMARKEGISTEEAGRKFRYQSFEKVLSDYGGHGKIAVAHNQNDQAETVLFHLFRGTGLTGLAGILPVRDHIIRPLLCIDRTAIETYLKKQHITWCIDETNSEDTYTRNKIRNRILPYVEKEIVSQSVSHIASTAEEMMQIRAYFEEQTRETVSRIVTFTDTKAVILTEPFNCLPNLMQRQVLLFCLERLTAGRKDIGASHILSIQALFAKSGSKEVHLPYQLKAVKQYQQVIIKRRTENSKEDFRHEVSIPESVPLPTGQIVHFRLIEPQKKVNIPQKSYTKWFDYGKILHCLMLRNRQTGDYLTINKELSHKKLNDYFIEEKIPKEDRDRVVVLADGSHIIWAMGFRISEYYKVTEETKQILEVSLE